MNTDPHIPSIGEILHGMFQAPRMVYTDYLSARIAEDLRKPDPEGIIGAVSPVKSDLHPEGGYLLTHTKTISVEGRNGRRYKITVEELRDEDAAMSGGHRI